MKSVENTARFNAMPIIGERLIQTFGAVSVLRPFLALLAAFCTLSGTSIHPTLRLPFYGLVLQIQPKSVDFIKFNRKRLIF